MKLKFIPMNTVVKVIKSSCAHYERELSLGPYTCLETRSKEITTEYLSGALDKSNIINSQFTQYAEIDY